MNKKQIENLDDVLKCGISFDKNIPQVKDISKFINKIDYLVDEKLAKNSDQLLADFYLLYATAWKLNIFPSSLQKINEIQASHENSTQINILSLDVTEYSLSNLRDLFHSMNQAETKLLSLRINPKEMDLTWFFPYISKILAAAILEKYSGPLFLQTDSIYFDPKNFENDRDNLLDQLKKITQNAIKSGIYNLNLNASELVNLDQSIASEKMLMNLKMVAMVTNLWVRNYQPNGITVSVSGKIGKGAEDFVQKTELKDYIKRLLKEGSRLRFNTAGDDISKIVVDYGSGSKISIDNINELNNLTQKEFGLGGVALDLGQIDNLSQITRLSNLEVCEIRLKLVDKLKNIKTYQEIIRIYDLQNKNDISDKYAMKIDQFPRMNEF
jgi:hypothetical protein